MDVTVQLSQKNCTCEIFFESKIKTGTGPVNLFTANFKIHYWANCCRFKNFSPKVESSNGMIGN